MKVVKFGSMVKGWFVGDFVPTAYNTKDCEVCLKEYNAGDSEGKHMHKVATEITLIIDGEVMMNGKKYKKGDIIIMEPGEATDFKALTNAKNVVVKVPSVKGDKYPVN